MKLNPKTSMLVAIGASTAANCTGCLVETVSMARELGAMDEQIGSAIEIGKRVRGWGRGEARCVRLDFAISCVRNQPPSLHLINMPQVIEGGERYERI